MDDDGRAKPLSDALLILRYMHGFTDMALDEGAMEYDAYRVDATGIAAWLVPGMYRMDIDGMDVIDPLTDGLLIQRYLFGLVMR